MIQRANLIGAILSSFAFLLVIFAGTLGQLFTMSGAVKSMPAYGTHAIPLAWDLGYADSLTYDEKGELMEYKKAPGRIIDADASASAVCRNRHYIYEIDAKIWIKGSAIAAVQAALRRQIEPHLTACAPAAGEDFSCAPGCETRDDDNIIAAKPPTFALQSANAVAPGVLQYVFQVNAGCIRVRQCLPAGE